jgi:hypothetical protein
VHAGINIPLRARKNTVAARKARVGVCQRHLLEALGSKPLLAESLRLGPITTIAYFSELIIRYACNEKYQELEREYHQVIARLLKYQLQ